MSQHESCRRRNGFQAPLNSLQIGTWILFPILIIHYFAFLYPLLWPYLSVRIVVTFIFLTSSIAALITGYLVCGIDPADDHILSEHSSTEANPVYCYLCETNVDCTSKHCRFCDKCIVGFDHHCRYVNTFTQSFLFFLLYFIPWLSLLHFILFSLVSSTSCLCIVYFSIPNQ